MRLALAVGRALRLSALAGAVLLAAPAVADGPAVDVHKFRETLWSQARPSGPEDIRKLKQLGIEWEKISRKPVLDDMNAWLTENGFRRPAPTGTPPHSPGSSGVFTDVDDTFAKLEDARAAARRYEELGYTVEWNAADTFSVKELDYTGFAKESPGFRPGSAEEVEFLRDAARFPDKVWNKGSQQWVRRIELKNKLDGLLKKKARIAEKLHERARLNPARREVFQSRLKKIERSVSNFQDELARVKVTDRTGFTVDMFNKAIHHMDPDKWCPMPNGFGCWEDPRQAAKAAARALKDKPGTLTAQQQARMEWLDDIAKGRQALPGDAAAFDDMAGKLRGAVNRSFHEAYEASAAADLLHDKRLLVEYRAAVDAGDAKAISRARVRLAERQLAARRIEATLEAMTEGEVAGGREALHEWMTGERIRRVETPGKPPSYEILEETADGVRVVGRRSAAEVQETALKALQTAGRRKSGKWYGGYQPPRFQSFAPAEETGIWAATKRTGKKMGAFGWLTAIYGAAVGSKEAVDLLNEPVEEAGEGGGPARRTPATDIPGWSEITSGDVTAEEMAGWAKATGVGTALAIGEVTGVSHVVREASVGKTTTEKAVRGTRAACEVLIVCLIYDAGTWYTEEATRAEVEAAQREGRAASRLNILRNIIDKTPLERLGKRIGKAAADWAKQRAAEIWDYGGAELQAIKAGIESSRVGAALEETLESGGFDKLAVLLSELHLQSAALEQHWGEGTQALTSAILNRQDLEIALDELGRPPDFAAKCEALAESLGEAPDADALADARRKWEEDLEAYRETLRGAFKLAVETLGDGLNAAAVFGDASGWQTRMAAQSELQKTLAARFGRLRNVLPDNAQIEAWRSEVQSAEDPVRIELRPDFAEDARSIALFAEEAMRKLNERGAVEVPTCEPLAPEDEEEEVASLPPDGEETDADDDQATSTGDLKTPALKLIAIERLAPRSPSTSENFGIDYTPGEAGFSTWGVSPAGEASTRSYGFTQFPLEIVLGAPFRITFEMAHARHQPGATGDFSHPCTMVSKIGAQPIASLGVSGSGEEKAGVRGQSDDFVCPSGDYEGAVSASRLSSLRLRFVPRGPPPDDPENVTSHRYGYRIAASGTAVEPETLARLDGMTVTIEWRDVGTDDHPVPRSSGLRASVDTPWDHGLVRLVYGIPTAENPAISATGYVHPEAIAGRGVAEADDAEADGGAGEVRPLPEKVFLLINVAGSGYVPHWNKASYHLSGNNDEVFVVHRDENPMAALRAYRERLIGEPCEERVSGMPGLVGRPTFWNAGPQITVLDAGPFLTYAEARYHQELEDDWERLSRDGPSFAELKKGAGCG